MSDKKHIDRLFQEKLKDFEATPSPKVWENISSNLSQKHKDRKVIPLWMKLAGIAAGIALLFTVGNLLIDPNDPESTPNNVVDTNTDTNDQNSNTLDPNKIDEENVASEDGNDLTTPEDEYNTTESTGNQLVPQTDDNLNVNRVATNPQKVNSSQKEAIGNDKLLNENDRVQNSISQNESSETQNTENEAPNTNSVNEKSDALINSENKGIESNVVETNDVEGELLETDEAIELNKTSLSDALKEKEVADIEIDANENTQRWRVMPNIAPVYFNSLSSGSSIDDQFINNSKTGDINMSYGITGSYDINDKLSVRAGINQVKLGYSTDDIIVYNNTEITIDDKPLKNVDLNPNNENLSFLSANELGFSQVPGVVADNISSSIDQELGFIEIPLELEYKISNKRLGVSLIGGFSTLFLNQNEIYSSLQGERELLGKASNINKTSFSANLGLGVKYNISKQIDLNLEPVFKYQLNTFNDTSGNFNPYFIGIYTGFSVKF